MSQNNDDMFETLQWSSAVMEYNFILSGIFTFLSIIWRIACV